MKKQIIALLLLIITSELVAETGYNGLDWFTNKKYVALSNEIESGTPIYWDFVKAQEKPILGQKTEIFYVFPDYEHLCAVEYSIDEKETKRLLEKFNNLVYDTNINTNTEEYFIGLYKDPEELSEKDRKAILFTAFGLICEDMESNGYKNIGNDDPEFTGHLYIYDYNDDTRVYIFENAIEGKTIVVYFPHEQDY